MSLSIMLVAHLVVQIHQGGPSWPVTDNFRWPRWKKSGVDDITGMSSSVGNVGGPSWASPGQ